MIVARNMSKALGIIVVLITCQFGATRWGWRWRGVSPEGRWRGGWEGRRRGEEVRGGVGRRREGILGRREERGVEVGGVQGCRGRRGGAGIQCGGWRTGPGGSRTGRSSKRGRLSHQKMQRKSLKF